MNFEEIVRAYQDGKGRQVAAMKKLEAAMRELSEANDSVSSSIGLMEAFLDNRGADNLWEGLPDGGVGLPGFMKSLFNGDVERLF